MPYLENILRRASMIWSVSLLGRDSTSVMRVVKSLTKRTYRFPASETRYGSNISAATCLKGFFEMGNFFKGTGFDTAFALIHASHSHTIFSGFFVSLAL